MNTAEHDSFEKALLKLGVRFHSPDLLERALTHKSFSNERPKDDVQHNELLEFLGDAVLGLAVSVMLMEKRAGALEGELSRLRAALVNRKELARVGNHLGLGTWLRLGKGEERSGGRNKETLLANALEAIIGAVFMESGLEEAGRLVRQLLEPRLEEISNGLSDFDPKSRLQELLQKQGRPPPVYRLQDASGPDHQRSFEVMVCCGEEELGCGRGTTKREAEKAAARLVLERMFGVIGVINGMNHEKE
jgi:ribonuclease III